MKIFKMRNSKKKLKCIEDTSMENYVLFDLNFRANKIKSGYLFRDCINALSDFIGNKDTRFLGA